MSMTAPAAPRRGRILSLASFLAVVSAMMLVSCDDAPVAPREALRPPEKARLSQDPPPPDVHVIELPMRMYIIDLGNVYRMFPNESGKFDTYPHSGSCKWF